MSGMLISVSRGISMAADKAAAARQLRDQINIARTSSAAQPTSADGLQSYQREFLDLAVASEALQFGDFVLKSGRESPYFFNAGRFCHGAAIRCLARYVALIE